MISFGFELVCLFVCLFVCFLLYAKVVLIFYSGNILLSTLGVAAGTCHSLYPVTLLAPVVLTLMKVKM